MYLKFDKSAIHKKTIAGMYFAVVGGDEYVPMQPACFMLGLDADREVKKLFEDGTPTHSMEIEIGPGKSNVFLALDRHQFILWLVRLNSKDSHYAPAKEWIDAFQIECRDLIAGNARLIRLANELVGLEAPKPTEVEND